MGQWYEQPDDSQEVQLFSAPKVQRSTWLVLAVTFAIVAAFALVLLLCACKSPPARTGEFRASFRIEYANGQEITACNASSDDSEMDGTDSRGQSASQTPANGDCR